MEKDVQRGLPSYAAAVVQDVHTPEARSGATASAPSSHPARLRLVRLLERAAAEVRFDSVDHLQLEVTAVPDDLGPPSPAYAEDDVAALRARVGEVDELDLPGWAADWQVAVSQPERWSRERRFLAAQEEAVLLVDLADWLQTAIAGAGVSEPLPPCPRHGHPLLPVERDKEAWWDCPQSGPVRRWG